MKRLSFLFCLVFIFACGDDDSPPPAPVDTFDRKLMLTNWADNIIIPGLQDFEEKTYDLQEIIADFKVARNQDLLDQTREKWEAAYLSWQRISMFDVGKAEEEMFRNFTNIYPLDVDGMKEKIANADFNLELPSEIDKQGFPALDYLLYGIAPDDTALLALYNGPDANNHLSYMLEVATRMHNLALDVVEDWSNGYRETFIENSGNNATASTDKLVNDYIFYYERFFRAGKVGIPAGVFSGSPLANLVEAPYRNDLSRLLFMEALNATQDFFNGIAYSGNGKGSSLADYLDELDVMKNGQLLSVVINDQFDAVRAQAATLSASFAEQVNTDNNAMLQTYDLLQMNVIYLKLDMLQALNINVDYVDADGD